MYSIYPIAASIMQSDDSDSIGRGGDNNDTSVVYDDSSSSSGDEGHIPKRKSARKVVPRTITYTYIKSYNIRPMVVE